MENITLEREIYTTINNIRKINRRHSSAENIVKVAAAKHGSNEVVLRTGVQIRGVTSPKTFSTRSRSLFHKVTVGPNPTLKLNFFWC